MTEQDTVYEFDQQLRRGNDGEALLDAYLRAEFGYRIKPASRDQQRQGIDRLLFNDRGECRTVEYKTDTTAGRTGNLFIETVSGDAIGRSGWAYTCSATWLFLYVPNWGTVFVFQPIQLRALVRQWLNRYPVKAVANPDYYTYGVLVPRIVIAESAEFVSIVDETVGQRGVGYTNDNELARRRVSAPSHGTRRRSPNAGSV